MGQQPTNLPDFPSFSEGLSLRLVFGLSLRQERGYFPSFSEGLSLRRAGFFGASVGAVFPFLFGGTFIEA